MQRMTVQRLKEFLVTMNVSNARGVFIVRYASRAGLSQPRDNVTAKLRERTPACREMCALRSAS